MILASLLILSAAPPVVEIPPLCKVIALKGKVEFKSKGRAKEGFLSNRLEIEKDTVVLCHSGASVTFLFPTGSKETFPKVQGEWERVNWKPAKNPRIEKAFSSRWEAGGSIRDIGDPNLWLPVCGAVRPGHLVVDGFGASNRKVSVLMKLAGGDWNLGDVEQSDSAVKALADKHMLEYSADLQKQDLNIYVNSGSGEFRSSIFFIPASEIVAQVEADLGEIDLLFKDLPEPEKRIARAGILNGAGFRSEAISELEAALRAIPDAQDIVDTLKVIYLAGGRKVEALVQERINKIAGKS